MKIVVIILIALFVLAILALLKASSDADDHAETLRDFEEEK